MNLRGNIDVIKTGKIEGWIYDADAPSSQCEVLARTSDGKVISEAIALKYREDLECNGIGDGRHAFELIIPYAFDDDKVIEIVEKVSNSHITGSPISIKGKRAPALETHPTLLVDLSDLIVYLEHHDNPTGIQRVVVGVLNAMVQGSLYPLQKIQPVYFNTLDGHFYQLDIHIVCSLIEDIKLNPSKRKFSRKRSGKQLFLEQATRNIILAEDLGSHIMLMLGAAWVFKGYFITIREMKRAGMKFVVLFHDLIPLIMPNQCHKGTAVVFKFFVRNALENADLVLSVSKNTKHDLVSYCMSQNIIPPPICVTKNGQHFKIDSVNEQTSPIREDYVLYVSTIEGRKNHLLAVQAWEDLINKHGNTIPSLVFVGRGGWCIDKLVEKLRDTSFLKHKVIVLPEVADETLVNLYDNCLFTIYPSCYEGWGLPVGESLYFGKVCLASDAASLPEVGGDLAVYFSSNDLQSFSSNAERLIFDSQFRTTIEERIRQNFTPITWDEVAENILNTIPDILQINVVNSITTLRQGEYSFAPIPSVDQEISDLNTMYAVSKSRFTSNIMCWDDYFNLDCALKDGLWYDQEDWGRWGHIEGNSLMFALNNDKPHILLLRITAPSIYVPLTLKLSTSNIYIEEIDVISVPRVIRVDLTRYTHNGIVSIGIKINQRNARAVENESRQIGIGFCSMILMEKEDVLQRLEVVERQLFS